MMEEDGLLSAGGESVSGRELEIIAEKDLLYGDRGAVDPDNS
jgi:hypothetical protein